MLHPTHAYAPAAYEHDLLLHSLFLVVAATIAAGTGGGALVVADVAELLSVIALLDKVQLLVRPLAPAVRPLR